MVGVIVSCFISFNAFDDPKFLQCRKQFSRCSDHYLLSIDIFTVFINIFITFQENYGLKIQKEIVLPGPGQSFKLFTPSLRNHFFWHYHPEYELVYVEALTGIRHVGQHISSFMESDLVLIGPNVPHLNFDYGI